LNSKIYLIQTDTTIGFVSQDASRLTSIKKRPPYKHYICTLDSLKRLKKFTRVPQSHKNRIRRSCKSTYIMPNGRSYRVVCDPKHKSFLESIGGWAFSTSANISGKKYDEEWARSAADVVIEPLDVINKPSQIFMLGKNKIKRVR